MDAKAKEQADRERLEKMTMKEIKALAKDEGISLGYDGSRKANAIGLILEWRRFKGCYMERY
jgi:hypothetical protein|nr:MAG TPA: HeH/LEM domain [Caudoviricetes sp.]